MDNASASPSSPPPLSVVVRVRTYELDSFGHVNNAEYLHYLEEARSEYLRQLGLSFNDFERLGVHLVIIEAHVKYVTPARYGDEVEIAGRFTEVKAASLVIDYTLTERGSGRLLATARTRGAFIDAATGRPVRAPEPFRAAFASTAATP